jgi:hypothetical protein
MNQSIKKEPPIKKVMHEGGESNPNGAQHNIIFNPVKNQSTGL